jgi:tRNA dimethylallyltransferase
VPDSIRSDSSPLGIPLVVILGPTAVGKTEVSIQLAERLGGEIVSADSRLFYRGMDIGTAKPTLAERARVPHHLVDIANPDEPITLAEFRQVADEAITSIFRRGRLPFLVGGTGLYIWALLEGWHPPEQPPDRALREILERWGHEIGPRELHRHLRVVDPEAARRIEPNNLRRTVRALEVIFLTGLRFSSLRGRNHPPYQVLICGLTRPRQELYLRIDQRIQLMLANGWMEEVRRLVDAGFSPELPGLSAIGYRQMMQVVMGELTLEEAVLQVQRLTRNFVRRQSNWFKLNDPRIHWFQIGPGLVEEMEIFIRKNIPQSILPPYSTNV